MNALVSTPPEQIHASYWVVNVHCEGYYRSIAEPRFVPSILDASRFESESAAVARAESLCLMSSYQITPVNPDLPIEPEPEFTVLARIPSMVARFNANRSALSR